MSKFYKLLEDVERYLDVESLKPIVKEDQIYNYIESLHHTPDDFIDGDLAERIEEYPFYILKNIELNDIDNEEFLYDESEVEDFADRYNEGSEFPPVVLDNNLRIIDGTHRVNSALLLGHKTIKAYVGSS